MYPHQKWRENLCIMGFVLDAVFPPFLEWISQSAEKILHQFLMLLYANFDFDGSVANDVAIESNISVTRFHVYA